MPQAQGEVLNLISGKPDLYRALQYGLTIIRASVPQSFTAVPTISTSEQTVVVPGVEVGDFVSVTKPTAQTGLIVGQARVSAKNTVAITFGNPTAGGITPTASEVYMVQHTRIVVTP